MSREGLDNFIGLHILTAACRYNALGYIMTTNRPLRVFLCHSSNDKPAVRELYQKLRAEAWIQPWLDEEELYPGQRNI